MKRSVVLVSILLTVTIVFLRAREKDKEGQSGIALILRTVGKESLFGKHTSGNEDIEVSRPATFGAQTTITVITKAIPL